MAGESANIGRSTVYGNPFRPRKGPGSSIPRFRRYARKRFARDPEWKEAVLLLQGKVLFCPGCGIDSPTCHGRVLEDLLKEASP